jgi:hypothetical protein
MDWRIAFGLSTTILWMGAGLFYLTVIVGPNNFVHLPTADIGSFLEGAFAPLAFLWLVIGHFMQQQEIGANTRSIKMQEKSSRRLELHSRQDSYFKLLSLVQHQLGAIAGFHYMSVCGPTGTGVISGEEFAEQTVNASGDHAWFIRKMIGLTIGELQDEQKMHDIFFGTPTRTRHTENFARTFKKLLGAAQAVDTEDLVTDALLNGSTAGLFYRIILNAKGESTLNLGTVAPASTPPENSGSI